MRPSTLWRYRRPLMRWGLFLLLSAAVGAGLHVVLPPEPRWERAAEPQAVFDVGAGRIAVCRTAQEGNTGPIQLLDAATGSELARFLDGVPTWRDHGRSEDGRYLVVIVPGPQPKMWRIRGIDFHEQREWQADEVLGPFESVYFAPRCNYLALRLKPEGAKGQPFVVRDTSTGRIVAQVRVATTVDYIAFSADGGAFVLGYRDADDTKYIRAVSTRTGKAINLDRSSVLAVAPDARYVVADCGDDGFWVADLADGTWRCSIGQPRPPVVAEARQEQVHLGLKFLASNYYAHRSGALRVRASRGTSGAWYRSLLSGTRALGKAARWEDVLFAEFGGLPGGGAIFAPDARHVLWPDRRDSNTPAVGCYDVQTGQRLWRRSWPAIPAHISYTPDSRHIVVRQARADEVDVLDATTGATVRTIAVPGVADQDATFACDGHTLTAAVMLPEMAEFWLWDTIREWLPEQAAPAPRMAVRAFDLATGEPVAEAACEQTSEWWLSKDRQSLITVYHDSDDTGVVKTVICCWDVPPQKPLRWFVGVPLALGAGLVALRRGWQWWRRRKPVQVPQPTPTPT